MPAGWEQPEQPHVWQLPLPPPEIPNCCRGCLSTLASGVKTGLEGPEASPKVAIIHLGQGGENRIRGS